MIWDDGLNASLPLWGWLLVAAAGLTARAVWMLRKRERERAQRWAEYVQARARFVGTERELKWGAVVQHRPVKNTLDRIVCRDCGDFRVVNSAATDFLMRHPHICETCGGRHYRVQHTEEAAA